MNLVHFDFPTTFRKLYKKGFQAFQEGQRGAENLYDSDETAWLAANGITTQYMYDYVEDDADEGQPGFGNALTIETVRRDYFLTIQGSVASNHVADADSWPSKAEEIDGIRWLPRILPKARAKLKGELPASMMYSCGGDRAFFHRNNIMPAEFLSLVWRNPDDDAAIVKWVKQRISD